MTLEIRFRYTPWQECRAVHRQALRIRATWSKAFAALRYELGRIGASDVVLESGYQLSQLRNDGLPYSNAKAEHGQARVSFKAAGVPMSFFFGGWIDLEQNVYMIALTLKALRAVDRYGCTQDGQQYKGWAQLPPGPSGPAATAEFASLEDAARFLWGRAGWTDAKELERVEFRRIITDPDVLRRVYRDVAREAHPDAGGSTELMAKVNRAKEFIERAGAA